MKVQNLLPLDLIAVPTGELLVIHQQTPDDGGSYLGIPLEGEPTILDVPEDHIRKLCSLTELPKVIHALLAWGNRFSPDDQTPISEEVNAIMQVVGEMKAIFVGADAEDLTFTKKTG